MKKVIVSILILGIFGIVCWRHGDYMYNKAIKDVTPVIEQRMISENQDRVDKARERAYNSGYDEGYEDAINSVSNLGAENIYDQGYDLGYDDGYSDGYDEGYDTGYADCEYEYGW